MYVCAMVRKLLFALHGATSTTRLTHAAEPSTMTLSPTLKVLGEKDREVCLPKRPQIRFAPSEPFTLP